MQDKIKVYEEILTLEPGSKLFFPLAVMLVGVGDFLKGEKVLTQGLAVHPEYMEARLLLLDVLDHLGQEDAAREHGEKVLDLLKKSEGFWAVWNKILVGKKEQDTRTALHFVQESLHDRPLTWSAILEQGLSSLLAGGTSNPGIPPVSMSEKEERSAEGPEQRISEEFSPAAVAGDEEREDILIDSDARTKTMADLLMKQEEYGQAADIYEALWRESQPGSERDALQSAMDEARGMMTLAGEEESRADAAASAPKDDPATVDTLNTLSALADRLERRAGS